MTSIKDRIRKLLALGQSPNEAEAMAAIAKANELMQLHGIEEGDLGALGDNLYELLISDAAWAVTEQSSKVGIWQQIIADAVGKWQGCVAAISNHTASFYGNSARSGVALAMYEYLCDASIGLWNKEKKRLQAAGIQPTAMRSIKTPFLYGVAVRIHVGIRDRYLQPENLGDKEGLILSTVDRARGHLLDELNMDTRKSSTPKYSKSSAAKLGYVRGEAVSTDSQLESQGRKKFCGK